MKTPRFNITIVLAVVILVMAFGGMTRAASPSTFQLQSGIGTSRATVSKDGQILATEASPSKYVNQYHAVSEGVCKSFYTVPNGKALVIKDMTGYMFVNQSTGGDFELNVGGCGQDSGLDFLSSQPADTISVHFSEGKVIGPGTAIYSTGFSAEGSILVSGYLIPASAAQIARAAISSKVLKHDVTENSRRHG